MKQALFDALKKSPNPDKQPDEDLNDLIEFWWNSHDPINRIVVLHDAIDVCFKNSEPNEDLSRICKPAQQIMTLLALACVSQDWMNKHYDEKNPYHDIPLRYVTGIELCTACIQDTTTVNLSKQSDASEITGERLVKLGENGFLPDQGWLPEKTIEEATKALWKSETNEKIPDQFEAQYYSRLTRILTRKNKYLAFDKKADASHPFLLPEVCKLFHERFKGVNVIHFGVINMRNGDSPLVLDLDEGVLQAEIQLFLEKIEHYENP